MVVFFSPSPALMTQIVQLRTSLSLRWSPHPTDLNPGPPPKPPDPPDPPNLISLEQRQPPQPPDPPDPPLVTSTATLVTAASPAIFVTDTPLLSASGIIGPAMSRCSSAIPSSDKLHLRSALPPSSLTAATKLLSSGGVDVSHGLFSGWAWPMNQDEVFSPYPHLLRNTPHLSIKARSHIFFLNEVRDWLLRFSLITIRSSCHGNVEVRRIDLIRTFAPSPYLIILSAFRRIKLFPSHRHLPHSVVKVVKPKRVTKEVNELILVDLVQIWVFESLSHLCLRVHIAQFKSFSHSAPELLFLFFSIKLSQLGLRFSESFISLSFIAEAIVIRSAFRMALTLKFSTLKVLSDSLTLIRAISGNLQSKEIIGIVKGIRSISSGFATVYLYRVCRSDNLIADVLVKRLFKLFSLCIRHHDLSHRFEFTSFS
ncbi:unnamed protein product [Eruca vesicaria subsp. sativa]|uniref:RNase H type-1 domain-containing protein n=1 Tax=Eruca vesicaria subsp. sativa TaxID=29727 RepID=A0ABC8LN12_ERUVS|nr:unnamed protein product [Eruca vesicaria subsp. sativa]